MTTKPILVCVAALALLGGCATAPNIPPDLQYSAPPAGKGVATIRGSQRPSVVFDDYTVFVFSVDGKRVMAGETAWNTPLTLTAGRHTVAVEFQRGSYSGRTELSFEAASGAAYEVRFDTDVQVYGRNSYVDFWIVRSSTGKAVTGIKRATVGLAGGQRTYIPIPIVVPAG